MKSYAGISSSRLELLEDRLKSDVLAELKAFDGRLLLHTEADDGTVHVVWEVVEGAASIQTLREVMDEAARNAGLGDETWAYRRIPITAEKSPDFSDVKDIVEIVAQLDVDRSAIIVNCQLGACSPSLFLSFCEGGALKRGFVSELREREEYEDFGAYYAGSAVDSGGWASTPDRASRLAKVDSPLL